MMSKSGNSNSNHWVKSIDARLLDLFYSYNILRDSMSLLSFGKKYQIIPIFGQIRALICGKKSKNKPLLLDLAGKLEVKLNLYYMPLYDKEDDVYKEIGSPEFHLSSAISIEQEFPKQLQIDIASYLKEAVASYRGVEITCEKLITDCANKLGGAHYDEYITQFQRYVEESTQIINADAISQYTQQLTLIILELSKEVLRKASEFTVFLNFRILQSKYEKTVRLLEFISHYKGGCYAFNIENNFLKLEVISEEGVRYYFDVLELGNNYLNIELTLCLVRLINTNGTTTLKVWMNEECIFSITMIIPFFLLNIEYCPTIYSVANGIYAESHQIYENSFSMDFFQLKAYSVKLDDKQILSMIEQLKLKPGQRYAGMASGSYGVSQLPNSNLVFSGDVFLKVN